MTSITSQPTTHQPAPSTTNPSKRKSPIETTASTSSPKVLHFTSRNPAWTYLKLQLITHPSTTITPIPTTATPLDPLTAKTHLTAALSQFLGLTGTAIPFDILKIAPETPYAQNIWVRVPRTDAPAVVAALSSWVGGTQGQAGGVAWRICARGNYLDAVVRGSGADLFVP